MKEIRITKKNIEKIKRDYHIIYCQIGDIITICGDNEDKWKVKIRLALKHIGEVKEMVQRQTGSYKYDSCYDDCLKIIKRILK